MSTLNIIGNGFDLWHSLPTSYASFYAFAKEVLDEMESFYLIESAQHGPWSDFENSLGKFDWQLFYDAHDHTDLTAENFRSSEAYSLEDDINGQADSLVEVVKDQFHDWIESIDISQAQKKTRFSKGDSFLSFNYTSTIQAIYGVDAVDILHIHGKADAYDDLIFGHGETMEEESELDENGDSNRTMFSDAEGAAKYPFYALQKPVSETINANIKFFDSLEGFSTINVIGHSLNDIDLPYFEEIARNAKYAEWRVYCYKIEDHEHYLKQLIKCGVNCGSILIKTYDELPIE